MKFKTKFLIESKNNNTCSIQKVSRKKANVRMFIGQQVACGLKHRPRHLYLTFHQVITEIQSRISFR